MSEVRHQPRADAGIDWEEIIATLRLHQAELHRRGVRHAALFGSLARGESRRTSDIDILIELDPRPPSAFSNMSGSRNTSRICSRSASTSPIEAA
jgi:predicted nucleotidyltransferase